MVYGNEPTSTSLCSPLLGCSMAVKMRSLSYIKRCHLYFSHGFPTWICQFAKEQTICGSRPSKSFLHTVVLSFQSSEHLQTSSHSGDGTEWNLFSCSWILRFIILKWAGESFLRPRMPQEEFQWVNTLQNRNDTAEDYKAGTNPYVTLTASPYFFIKIYKLASLLGKKSDPAYLNAENLLQGRSQGNCMCQV